MDRGPRKISEDLHEDSETVEREGLQLKPLKVDGR